MNTPSRRMPPQKAPTKLRAWHWIVLTAIGLVGLWLLYTHPPLGWVVGGFVVLLMIGSVVAQRYFARLSQQRSEESICTFARALPARKHDTWIVRAVYEEVTRFVRVPVRPSDDLAKDLCMHPDDRDDIALEIAYRAGRSMEAPEKNPMFDRVKTVADMVAFFEHQPKLANQTTEPTRFARGSS